MKVRLLGLSAMAGSLFVATQAQAIISHAAEDGTIIPGPVTDVVGSWNGNGSAVAIAPNYIITVGHPGGGVGSTVNFGGTTYKVAEIFNHPTADLRIARITTTDAVPAPANLADYVSVYSTPITSITNMTLGGFGRGRGAALTNAQGTYGYLWNTDGNTTLRYGLNKIDGATTAVDSTFGYTSDVYVADFDKPGTGGAILGEAMITEFDSGGGWFINDGGIWKVAALNRAAGHTAPNGSQPANEALYASFVNANFSAPDGMDAVNLSSYTTFINSVVPEPSSAALLSLAGAAFAARRRRSHR